MMNEVRCTPNIRFPGFNSDWRKCKLSDVLEVVTKRNGTKYTKCDVLSVSDEYGCVNQIRFQGRSFAGDDISNYKIVQTGDIVYTRSPLQAKPFGIIKLVTNETGIVSPLYIVNQALKDNSPEFIYYLFDSPIKTNNYLSPLVRKGAKNTMNISEEEWLSGEICITTSYEEQQKIADFLSSVDEVITACEAEVQNFETQKKAVMKKIFSQEVRFKREDGTDFPEWDIIKLSRLGNCKNGINYSTKENVKTIRCLGVRDFKDKTYIDNIDELSIISLSEIPADDYLLQDGDIVFVRSNGNKSLVGRCVVVYPGQTKVTFSGFCIRLRLENSIIQNDFLLNVLKTEPMRKAMQGRGSDIHNLNQAILDDLDIPIPCIEEQHLIADFLSDFDEAVSAAKKELELWKELKKGLLQQMFV